MRFVVKPVFLPCLLAFIGFAALPAYAQATPADLVAQATPKPAAPKAAKTPPPIVTLEIIPIKSFALSADQLVPPGVLGDQQILLDGNLNIRFAKNLRAFYNRVNHFDVGGRTYKSGKPNFGGASWDLEQQEGLRFDATRNLQLSEFYRYRYRICCPNAGDRHNATPRFYGGVTTAADWRLLPRSKVGRPLLLHLEGTDVFHHLDLGVAVPKGTTPPGYLWTYKAAFEIDPEIFGQDQFQPYLRMEHYDDYFANSLVPSWTNRSFYGFRLKGTEWIAYRAYAKSEHQTNPAGDVPHKVELYIEAVLKFHS